MQAIPSLFGYARLASPTFTGTLTADALTATGLFTQAGEDSITAFAGGGKASATALSATKNLHRIATCATAADSVLMPPALTGQAHYLRNDGAQPTQVFGQGTDTINGVATGTGISHAPGMGVWYVCVTNGAWTTSPVDTITATTRFLAANGAVGTPAYSFSAEPNGGWYRVGAGTYRLSTNGTDALSVQNGTVILPSGGILCWGSGGVGSPDTAMTRASSNSILSGVSAVTTTSRTQINKTVTAIADATPTATFTVTIPNAAHSAVIEYELTGIIGAGGAIGVNEAAATTSGKIIVTRTPGVNAVASAVSAAFGAVAANVAGATTVTCAAAVSAIAGAVGASNTFTINVTITKAGGASANHICLAYAKLMNANATGITIA